MTLQCIFEVFPIANCFTSRATPIKVIELKRYLKEPRTPYKKGFDILTWWKQNGMRFPIVSRMAKGKLL